MWHRLGLIHLMVENKAQVALLTAPYLRTYTDDELLARRG